jgi:hypothetical protein
MDGSCPASKLNHMYHALPEISLHKLFCVCALRQISLCGKSALLALAK